MPKNDITITIKATVEPLKKKIKEATKTVEDSTKKMKKSTEKVQSSFDKLRIKVNAFRIAMAGTVIVVGKIVSHFARLEVSMVNVGNLFGASQAKVKSLKNEIIKLGSETGTSFLELSRGLYDTISAGIESGKAIKFLSVANKLAVAGLTDTKTVVDGLTSVLNAYKFETEDAIKISDKFFQAQKLGKTTIERLSATFGGVASVAKKAGVSIDELLGTIVALTRGGVSTTQAVTGLRAIFSTLLKPSAEAVKMSKQLGIEFNVSALRAKGLAKFLGELEEQIGENNEKFAQLFPNIRALKAILGLTEEQINTFTKGIKNSSGETERAYKRVMGLLIPQFKVFKAKIGEFFDPLIGGFLELGTMGFKVVNPIIEWATKISNKLGELHDTVFHDPVYGFWKGFYLDKSKMLDETLNKSRYINKDEVADFKKRHKEQLEIVREYRDGVRTLTDKDIELFYPSIKDKIKRIREHRDFLRSVSAGLFAELNKITAKGKIKPNLFLDAKEFFGEFYEGLRATTQGVFHDIKDIINESTDDWSDNLADKLIETRDGFEALRDTIDSIGKDIARNLLKTHITDPLIGNVTGLLSNIIAPLAVNEGDYSLFNPKSLRSKRASGGGVNSGQPYLVGENGAELFIPNTSGRITTRGGMGNYRAVTVNNNFSLGVDDTVRARILEAVPQLISATKNAVFEEIERGGVASRRVGRD